MIFSIHIYIALVEQQPSQHSVLLHLRAVLSAPTPEEQEPHLRCLNALPSCAWMTS